MTASPAASTSTEKMKTLETITDAKEVEISKNELDAKLNDKQDSFDECGEKYEGESEEPVECPLWCIECDLQGRQGMCCNVAGHKEDCNCGCHGNSDDNSETNSLTLK